MATNSLIICNCGAEIYEGNLKKCVKCGKKICARCVKLGNHCKDCFSVYFKEKITTNGFEAKAVK